MLWLECTIVVTRSLLSKGIAMTKPSFRQLALFTALSLVALSTYAWTQSVELGYGYSHDPNNIRYHNQAVMLSGDFYTITQTPWSHWSFTGTLGQWWTSAPANKNLTAGAVSLALRLYPILTDETYSPYLMASFGPALLSSREFGVNTQAKNITILSNGGFGVEVGHYDFNLRLAHFSNASIWKPNEGFNVLYFFSVGYLFN